MEPGDTLPYKTAKAFESALTARIATKAATSPYGVAELRRQFAYGRLLSRVFQHQPALWVLKGATGLLARMPGQARHSMDVDLFFDGKVEMSVEALREAANLDLGDFFTFDSEEAVGLVGVTAGSQLRITSYLGDKEFEVFRVDVVVTDTMTAEPELGPPIEPVEISGLSSVAYRIYPVADHIADKHAAMIQTYGEGQPSTRYRDLVDLVLIATNESVKAKHLRTALLSEYRRRQIATPSTVSLPSSAWRDGYTRIAATVPDLAYLDASDALRVVRKMLEPVLAGRTNGVWDPDRLSWMTSGGVEQGGPPHDPLRA